MKYISLTFDDGPTVGITDQVLDILEEEKVTASFFLIADRITPDTEYLMKRALSLGCTLENHSRTHMDMRELAADEILSEISYTSDRIFEVTGESPHFFRPPFIYISQRMYDMIRLPFICGFGCEDWLPEIPAKERARRVLADAHDGEIVLLHDMENNQATVDALREIIPALKSMGYGLINIRELFRKYDICPSVGRTYSGVFDIRPDDF